MIYKKFKDLELSGLGLGMMRLPVVEGNDGAVDEVSAAELIDYAYKSGINYFDTAWGYREGNSELIEGSIYRDIPERAIILPVNFRGMTFPTWERQRKYLKSSLKSVVRNTLISICFIMSMRGISTHIWIPGMGLWSIC